MKFAVLAYNFHHWKTQNGLINLVCNGFTPSVVILQNKKQLNVPTSKYRITPDFEYLQDPKELCKVLGLKFKILDHDKIVNETCDLAVILGARILPQRTIDQFPKGILNIHPGILPGNRGLDNLKWSLIKGLPIGCTAHLIDSRVDMGYIVCKAVMNRKPDETIRELHLRQRGVEQQLLLKAMSFIASMGTDFLKLHPVSYSEKFSAVPDELDHYEECSNSIELS